MPGGQRPEVLARGRDSEVGGGLHVVILPDPYGGPEISQA